MSLITLTSKDSTTPYNFDSYFPQPIKIEKHSQVCVLKFIHYRDDDYIINQTNDTLLFVLGNGVNDAQREVRLTRGTYKASELATHIADAMNSKTQQQNYQWACTYATISDKFEISYTSTASPAVDGGDWAVKQTIKGESSITPGALTVLESSGITGFQSHYMLDRGIHLNAGTFVSEGMRVRIDTPTSKDNTISYRPEFVDVACGLVRNANSFDDFDREEQDIICVADTGRGGLVINSWDTNTGLRELRYIPQLAFSTIGGPVDWTDKTQVLNSIYKVKMTLLEGGQMKVIFQLQVSTDGGVSYTDMTTTYVDPRLGNTYFRSYVESESGLTFDGCFFVSDDQDFYDTAELEQAKFCSARAPYKPTQEISMFDLTTQGDMSVVDFQSGDSQQWSGNVGATAWQIAPYTGANTNIQCEMADIANLVTYYISALSVDSSDILTYNVYGADTDPLPVPAATMIYDPDTGELAFSVALGGETQLNYTGTLAGGLLEINPEGSFNMIVSGVFNANVRNISKIKAQHLDINTEDIIVDLNTVYVGTDLSKTSQLFVGRLNQSDINLFKGSPAFITSSTKSGDIQLTIGAKERIYVGTVSTGKIIFTSDTATSPLGRSSTLHIGMSELPVKSYEGGNNNIGKSIAVIPREEFRGTGNSTGRLVYVADFENWVDLSNASDLYLNQFKVEIRNEDATLATDLIPETMLQIKIRKNPDVIHRETMERLFSGNKKLHDQEVSYTGS
jgi:hypothetical protein